MKRLSPIKYTAVLTLPLTVAISFESGGWLTYFPLIYVFGFIPLLELIVGSSQYNFSEEEEKNEKKNLLYNLVIYSMLPIQYAFLVYFCFSVFEGDLTNAEVAEWGA